MVAGSITLTGSQTNDVQEACFFQSTKDLRRHRLRDTFSTPTVSISLWTYTPELTDGHTHRANGFSHTHTFSVVIQQGWIEGGNVLPCNLSQILHLNVVLTMNVQCPVQATQHSRLKQGLVVLVLTVNQLNDIHQLTANPVESLTCFDGIAALINEGSQVTIQGVDHTRQQAQHLAVLSRSFVSQFAGTVLTSERSLGRLRGQSFGDISEWGL